ncbi:hypothetical protein COY95_04795 [Candidatus Woesearchaeota archaeon CG_4_10_14_0_8_um_filter_47_5]|nr:MAG: hypothetical protein COY95_04795 [Candidatus Woesearchaeota archaeon CG_4_10_14_0_8_um_filter_47_5]
MEGDKNTCPGVEGGDYFRFGFILKENPPNQEKRAYQRACHYIFLILYSYFILSGCSGISHL